MFPGKFLAGLLPLRDVIEHAVIGWSPGEPTRLPARLVNEELRAHLREAGSEHPPQDWEAGFDYGAGRPRG